ncbi:uncharacterized protein Z518_03639 [Rhinocladiella mackenziei CBS 650.93]|uniref:Rhinocladiella mackenziei CBS 650.93 unplaced genomic scaffold supercont1.3, whole genome shotgun sequence n=1 Tax=Rhinocladiella mackenziei CBS 650.93 TaxID=1442369 RepID=A0A0D2FU88_9EURO|nr:uncharacterized protein Z518_03639 [Rhinocladiella mackenziei CBS 650.93]KIX05667.1 hypothetical protein Z518_03639 [Rhinocladiella mackenziei CBS 650.93]
MAENVHRESQEIVDDIKSGLHGIHGTGEAIRGGAMEALDTAFHKQDGEAQNRETAERGIAEMRRAKDRFEERHHHHMEPGHSQGHSHPRSHGQGSHFAHTHDEGESGGTNCGSSDLGVGLEEGDRPESC